MVICIAIFLVQPFRESVTAHPPDSLVSLWDIRQSVVDGSEDDWLGKRVTVGGIVNVATGLLHERYLQIFIQSDSAGIPVFSETVAKTLTLGDSIVVRGKVVDYYGLIEVMVEGYEVFPGVKNAIESRTLKQVMETPAKYEGMLMADRGVIRSKGSLYNGKFLMVAPDDTSRQSIMVYVSNFHTRYPEFDFDNLSTGDGIHVTGVLTRQLADSLMDTKYMIQLRVPTDLEYTGIPKVYLWLSILMTSGIFILILGWIGMLKVQVGRQTSVIKKALQDKEVLLQEIHHRIKNNLAIISGLIELQLDSTSDEAAVQVLKDSQVRIQAMALVHEKLYTSGMHTSVQMDVYIKELVEAIHQTFIEKREHVEIDFWLEPVELELQQVIPCGLLINELIVNAFKHAFKGIKAGQLRVSLQQNNGHVELMVADNGPGLPEDVSMNQAGSLGFMLIQTFVSQLSAEMKLDGNDGTSYTFLFRQDTG